MYTGKGIGLGIATLGVILAGWSCQPAETATEPEAVASFDLIQQRILTPSCATSGCHASDKDGSFAQHGLVLAAGVAYQNLVGVDPGNSAARTDGLKRVKAFASLESLLYHKLTPTASHHSGKQYGNPMPLGGQLLSDGQIEFVRRWIDAGAPKTGTLAQQCLLCTSYLTKCPSFLSMGKAFTSALFHTALLLV